MNQIPNIEEVETLALTLQKKFCCYGTEEGKGGTCDCKFITPNSIAGFEETGCAEARTIIWKLKELEKTLHQQLQKALRCGKDMGDGSICGCKLNCHLHDWRQREQIQIAHQDWLREEIVKLEGMEVKNGTVQNWYGRESPITEDEADGFNVAIATIIDRYQAELDQDK